MPFDASRAFDTSQVSPTDAAVTLRSLRRRFAQAFDQVASAEELTNAPGGAGLSPLDHAAATAAALGAIGAALHRVLVTDDPEVTLPTATDGSGRTQGEDPATVLTDLGDVAGAVADAMADVHGDAWNRSGHGPNGTVSALDIARLGVAIAVGHLRAAERLITP